MHTITITESPNVPLAAEKLADAPTAIVVETGDHLVITRKVDKEKHRAALRSIIERMKNRTSDPTVETASEAIKAMREERGG